MRGVSQFPELRGYIETVDRVFSKITFSQTQATFLTISTILIEFRLVCPALNLKPTVIRRQCGARRTKLSSSCSPVASNNMWHCCRFRFPIVELSCGKALQAQCCVRWLWLGFLVRLAYTASEAGWFGVCQSFSVGPAGTTRHLLVRGIKASRAAHLFVNLSP